MCIFFKIEATLSKIMELKITILDVGWWEKPWLKLGFHLIPRSDLTFSTSNPLGTKVSPP